MARKIIDVTLSGLFLIAIAILIVTVSIGLPIYFRPFYYMQIETLEIPEQTGYSYEEIKQAYDEVLDYLVLPGKDFGTGVFRHSDEGEGHFKDCKFLFNLNITALIISLVLCVTILLLERFGKVKLKEPKGLPLYSYAGIGTLLLFVLIGAAAALDFDKAFQVFHMIFFPGKDNWVFNPYKDEIIKAMPQDFFMNCAILIVASIILLCSSLIILGVVKKKIKKEKSKSFKLNIKGKR